MIFIAFIELWNGELDESPGMQLSFLIILWVQNAARVTKKRPDDLKIVTTLFLTSKIVTFTTNVGVEVEKERIST